MYDSRLKLANQIYDEVKRHFQELVFKTVIQRNVKLSESPSHGLPVILYDADSTGSKNHLALAKEIINNNIVPVVFLDRNPGLKDISLVATDNHNGMYQATRYLITLGHRKIMYLGGREGTSTDNDRLAGFRDAISDSAIDDGQIAEIHADFAYQKAFESVSSMIAQGTMKYTAIASANDTMAMGAMKALKNAGLRIPEDISIIGYDDIPSAAFAELTTVRQPFAEMGRTAIMQLMASIADFSAPKKTTVLPSSIVFRNSCAIPKSVLPS